jgi:hypothetical protein
MAYNIGQEFCFNEKNIFFPFYVYEEMPNTVRPVLYHGDQFYMYKYVCTTHVSLQSNLLMLSPLLRGHLSYKTIFSLGRCGHDLDRIS